MKDEEQLRHVGKTDGKQPRQRQPAAPPPAQPAQPEPAPAPAPEPEPRPEPEPKPEPKPEPAEPRPPAPAEPKPEQAAADDADMQQASITGLKHTRSTPRKSKAQKNAPGFTVEALRPALVELLAS